MYFKIELPRPENSVIGGESEFKVFGKPRRIKGSSILLNLILEQITCCRDPLADIKIELKLIY